MDLMKWYERCTLDHSNDIQGLKTYVSALISDIGLLRRCVREIIETLDRSGDDTSWISDVSRETSKPGGGVNA